MEEALYAQSEFNSTQRFSDAGKFKGMTVDELANDIRNGKRAVEDVEVITVTRDGQIYIMDTRTGTALDRAGVPRSNWNTIDATGDAAWEQKLTDRLKDGGGVKTAVPSPPK